MHNEKIKVRVTETGQTMEVVVLSKRADRIEVAAPRGGFFMTCLSAQLMQFRPPIMHTASAS